MKTQARTTALFAGLAALMLALTLLAACGVRRWRERRHAFNGRQRCRHCAADIKPAAG